MAQQITTPAAIHKIDIALTRAVHGHVNATAFKLDGITHKSRSLKFITFAGSLAGGQYRGEYQFEAADSKADLPTADFSQLPGLGDEGDAL